MARKETKSATILRAAKSASEMALNKWEEAQRLADTAKAVYNAMNSSYRDLEALLEGSQRKPRSSSTKSGAKDTTANGKIKKGTAGNAPSELARVLAKEWNATPEHVQIALNEAQGDEPTALQLLVARGQVKGDSNNEQ